MGLETATLIAIIGAAGTGGAAVASGALQASGAKSAAKTNAAAATDAAQIQSKTAADTLAFEKQQADQTQSNTETTRKANYDQWAAQQQSYNAVRQQLGLAPLSIPAYVPLSTTSFSGNTGVTGTGTATAPAVNTPAVNTPAGTTVPTVAQALQPGSAVSSGNPTDPAYIKSQLQQLYAQHGVTPTGSGSGPTDIDYYAQQIASTGGWQGGNASYWTSRIASDLSGATGGTSASAAPGTKAAFTSPMPSPNATQAAALPPALMASGATDPQSVEEYLRLFGQGA